MGPLTYGVNVCAGCLPLRTYLASTVATAFQSAGQVRYLWPVRGLSMAGHHVNAPHFHPWQG